MVRVTVKDGEEGRGYPDGTEVVITYDERADIAKAVELEHNCDDDACDIRAALAHDCPYSAAYLLSGATETPLLGKVLDFYGVNLHYMHNVPDWDDWMEAHNTYGIQCESCEAFNYGLPDSDTPKTCGNCLAELPKKEDEDGNDD